MEHAPEALATPRPSTSVILVRDGPAGLETFMVRRHAASRVAPSAYVFPGGTVRADDVLGSDGDGGTSDLRLVAWLCSRSDAPVDAATARAVYVCAVRELFEEAGVLLAHDGDGHIVQIDAEAPPRQAQLAAQRIALQSGQRSLASILGEWAWQPAFDRLVAFSHWVTPSAVATRFDTRFFLAEMPPGQSALHCQIETSEGMWLRPVNALEGALHVVFPTQQHLRRLVPFGSVGEAMAFAQEKSIRRVEPEMTPNDSRWQVRLRPDLVDAW